MERVTLHNVLSLLEKICLEKIIKNELLKKFLFLKST
jgi:hypothetical protein